MHRNEARHVGIRHRLSLAFVALTIGVVLFEGPAAQAYNLWSYGYVSRSIGINTSSKVSSTWSSPITNAINSWNNASVGASISQGGAYTNYMETGDYNSDFIGNYCTLSTNTTGRHRTTRFKIQLNTEYNSQGTTYMRSTVAHELGHALGLDHEYVYNSLMNTGRNRFVIYVPQLDDKSGVLKSWE